MCSIDTFIFIFKVYCSVRKEKYLNSIEYYDT